MVGLGVPDGFQGTAEHVLQPAVNLVSFPEEVLQVLDPFEVQNGYAARLHRMSGMT